VITGKEQNTAGLGHDAGCSDHRRILVPCLLLFGLVAWTLLPAVQNGFVNYDDNVYVTGNSQVQGGLTRANVEWAFQTTSASNWHPLTWLSHMLDCSLFGLKPWGHHLTSVLLHAANTVLVFLALRRLTGALWRSLCVAAVFGLHPLRVESVAWVAERKDVLSAFFFLLTLLAYARYAQKKSEVRSQKSEVRGVRDEVSSVKCQVSSGEISASNLQPPTHTSHLTPHNSRFWSLPDYWVAVLLFALGLMCKPMLVTLPFVLLLLDFWPLRRVSCGMCQASGGETPAPKLPTINSPLITHNSPSNIQHPTHNSQLTTHNFRLPTLRRLLVEKLPFFALSIASCIITFIAQKRGGAMAPMADVPFSDRAANALVSYCRYLGKVVWPEHLSVMYPAVHHWPAGTLLVSGLVMAGLSVLAVALLRRLPCFPIGWFWFVGMLTPVIGLVPVGDQSMADRYSYLPTLGLFIVAVWGLYDLVPRGRSGALISGAAATASITVCILLTRQNLGCWRNSETLFRHAIANTENNDRACSSLGSDLLAQGRTDEAVSAFEEAVRLKPGSADTHKNLGAALGLNGRMNEAATQFRESLRIQPEDPEALFNLAKALERNGRLDEAIESFQRAESIRPGFAICYANLGVALANRGRIDEAITQLREALRLDPNDALSRSNLEIVLRMKGQ
jgi:Flp pilus assembly protein TadD